MPSFNDSLIIAVKLKAKCMLGVSSQKLSIKFAYFPNAY